MSLLKLGFNRSKKRGLDTLAMGGTSARTEVSTGDSTATMGTKKFSKPAGGK